MNEEIKEILKGMKKANNEDCNLWLENESVKLLYNYITNLQKENEDIKKLNNANYLSFIDVNKKRLKAIEYIQNHQLVFELSTKEEIGQWFNNFYKNVINILNGGDE